MLWTLGGAIVASIVLHIIVSMADGSGGKTGQRDRERNRLGDYIGQSFVVMGGSVALIMAMLEFGYFWIANAIYLTSVLSALLGSTAKIFAYRKGFHPWWTTRSLAGRRWTRPTMAPTVHGRNRSGRATIRTMCSKCPSFP